ncbi:zinc-binding protein A33-like [Lepisosteus oculatus]|uniref:zinc-binding protein A33-like n=1 Tax=Lepisosteus oculatus TaxID=7918 RepID=UPI0035F52DCB
MDSAVDELSRLREDLTCPLCLDLFRNPVLRECGHHFCQECVGRCWEGPGESARCPLCGRGAVDEVVQDAPLLGSVAETVREMMGDRREATGKRKREQYCEEHGQKLKLFCQEDGKAICVACGSSQLHQSHSLAPLDEVLGKYREKLGGFLQQIRKEVKKASRSLQTAEDMSAVLKDDRESIEKTIEAEFAELHRFLDREEAAAKAKLRHAEEEKRKALERNRTRSEAEKCRLLQAKELLKDQLALHDDPAAIESYFCLPASWNKAALRLVQRRNASPFLARSRSALKREGSSGVCWRCSIPTAAAYCRKCIGKGSGMISVLLVPSSHRKDLTFQKPADEYISLSSEEYVGPLQYAVWKKMKDILTPAPLPVTFDPDTANPHLILSNGNTTAKTGGTRRALAPKPERFDTYLNVLGSRGFTSGRHYWEVWVGNKSEWELGVAAASVERKLCYQARPADKVWIIALDRGGSYTAHDFGTVTLRLNSKPRKIGVYVDYGGGRVVFHNAEDMTVIYTFIDIFEEKIYPIFNPGHRRGPKNRKALRIVTPQV